MTTQQHLTTTGLWDIPRVGAPTADATGDIVVVPVTTHRDGTPRTRLWLLEPGGAPRPLTAPDSTAGTPRLHPDGSAVAFVRPIDDTPQVHVLRLDGGEARQVTDLPLGVVGSARWVGGDRLLVVTSLLEDDPTPEATRAWHAAERDGPRVLATERRTNRAWDTWYAAPLTQHVLLHDLDGSWTDLTPGSWLLPDPLEDPAQHCDVSLDGRWLAFTSAARDGEAESGVALPHVHVVDLHAPGPPRDVTPDISGMARAPRFLPDGRLLVPFQDERGFYAAPVQLALVDPGTGAHTPLLTEPEDLFTSVTVGPDGRIVVAADRRGRGRLLEVTTEGTVVELPAPASGGLSSPVVTEAGVLALEAGLTAPPEVALVGTDDVVRLTDFTAASLEGVDLGTVEERTVTGHDGDDVQVFVIHPPSGARETTDGPLPLVHLIHGGPHGTFGDTWHWRWCAARWAAEGWLVAMVNFHGSTSFSHDFTRSIVGDWATAPTVDVLAATDDLVAAGLVDEDRMAIAGGSYGGYLTVWLTTRTDRFATAVAHAAVTDFGGMWASDWTHGMGDAFGARLWEDPAATMRFSPSWHYGEMSTPMLVVHGDRDLRVPIDQGRALFGVLQDMRIPSRLVVFPDENHWVLGRAASERWYDEVLGWLHRWLDAD